MEITWAGWTRGRIKVRQITWRCDCGQANNSAHGPDWNRVLICLRCYRKYEVTFGPIRDAIES